MLAQSIYLSGGVHTGAASDLRVTGLERSSFSQHLNSGPVKIATAGASAGGYKTRHVGHASLASCFACNHMYASEPNDKLQVYDQTCAYNIENPVKLLPECTRFGSFQRQTNSRVGCEGQMTRAVARYQLRLARQRAVAAILRKYNLKDSESRCMWRFS